MNWSPDIFLKCSICANKYVLYALDVFGKFSCLFLSKHQIFFVFPKTKLGSFSPSVSVWGSWTCSPGTRLISLPVVRLMLYNRLWPSSVKCMTWTCNWSFSSDVFHLENLQTVSHFLHVTSCWSLEAGSSTWTDALWGSEQKLPSTHTYRQGLNQSLHVWANEALLTDAWLKTEISGVDPQGLWELLLLSRVRKRVVLHLEPRPRAKLNPKHGPRQERL